LQNLNHNSLLFYLASTKKRITFGISGAEAASAAEGTQRYASEAVRPSAARPLHAVVGRPEMVAYRLLLYS